MKAEHLQIGDIIKLEPDGQRCTVTGKTLPTVTLNTGTILPRTTEVIIVSFHNQEDKV